MSAHGPESALATVTLTPEAEGRLDLAVAPVTLRSAVRTAIFPGEVMVSTGNAIAVAAPVAGTVASAGQTDKLRAGASVVRGDVLLRLVPLATVERDTRAQSQRGVDAAKARADAAGQRLARTAKLLEEGAGTARAVEEARAENDVARAEYEAAKSRLTLVGNSPLESDVSMTLRAPRDGFIQKLTVAPGQTVQAGALLFEIVGDRANWVRVSVFVDEATGLKRDAPARVHLTLAARDPGVEALPIPGPPTADPVAATVDSFYELPPDARFAPGQRTGVALSFGAPRDVPAVAASAVVYDAAGGSWVYVKTAEHQYARARVDLLRIDGEFALLARGPAAGTNVVTRGVAELFGTEFGAGH